MRAWKAVWPLTIALVAGGATARVADRVRLPFSVGERLSYKVNANGVGGHGTMSVDGPVDVRGREAYHLRFDVKAGVGPIKGKNVTESWLDPDRMAALRFRASERRPFSKHDEQVELYPEERRWETEHGKSGESPTDAPLDELSFIYFVRSLALDTDSTYTFDRYYDPQRNPTTVRVISRDALSTAAGEFRTVLVEMRVRDPEHYKGEGRLRFYLSDDACRIPVRIESAMPNVGLVTFSLESYEHPSASCTAERQ
ncbi:MAG TPA: DUF3108 domain-containing protein [Gemmatimonadaceae bacterium]|nr:DUF3108 domain-containing protein [Gemmatimonadaceae bacterium]